MAAENEGRVFWGRKKTLREWPHALPSFRAVLFWLPKKTLRAWGHALPSFRVLLFWLPETPLRAWGHALPSLGEAAQTRSFSMPNTNDTQRLAHTVQIEGTLTCLRPNTMSSGGTSGRASSMAGARARTRRLRGASSVCQTTGQSDDGGPFGQGIPRSEPSFPRSEPSFSDTKATFLTSF